MFTDPLIAEIGVSRTAMSVSYLIGALVGAAGLPVAAAVLWVFARAPHHPSPSPQQFPSSHPLPRVLHLGGRSDRRPYSWLGRITEAQDQTGTTAAAAAAGSNRRPTSPW